MHKGNYDIFHLPRSMSTTGWSTMPHVILSVGFSGMIIAQNHSETSQTVKCLRSPRHNIFQYYLSSASYPLFTRSLTIFRDLNWPKHLSSAFKIPLLGPPSRNIIKNSFKFNPVLICWAPTIIAQIALQLTSAHSYGGRGRVGRNEGVKNLKNLGDILGDILGGYTWGNICLYFQQRTCRFEHLDSCTSKADKKREAGRSKL